MLLLALSCQTPEYVVPPVVVKAGEPCRGATWAIDAEPFVLDYCTACHQQELEGEDRRGAPEGIDLATPDQVRSHAERVRARVEDGTMPPGGGAHASEIRRFLDWVDCSDEAEARTPPEVTPWAGGTQVGWADASAGFSSDFPEGLTLDRLVDGTGSFFEYWLIDDDGAWLVGWESDEAGATWDPPLPMWGAAESVETTATLWDATGSWEEEQSWTVTDGGDRSDPRVRGRQLTVRTLVEDSTGDLQSVEWSTDEGFGSRTVTQGSETWWFITGPGLFWGNWDGSGFPIDDGRFWAESYLLLED